MIVTSCILISEREPRKGTETMRQAAINTFAGQVISERGPRKGTETLLEGAAFVAALYDFRT